MTIGRSQEPEFEIERKVKEEHVRLIEQNIIAPIPLEPSRVTRLIVAKSTEEKVNKEFTTLYLLKVA